MARKVFYSFHYKPDSQRASKVRNMGRLEGNQPVSANRWEQVKRSGDPAIRRWIQQQMRGKTCVVVLIGTDTASRRWVNYEIRQGWNSGLGVVGIRINKMTDLAGHTATRGANPLSRTTLGNTSLDRIAKTYDPAGTSSAAVYRSIYRNIDKWVEEAITIRARHG